MKVKDIIFIKNAINSALDFIHSNCDSDQSGIGYEMEEELNKSKELLDNYKQSIYLKNEIQKIKRNRNKTK